MVGPGCFELVGELFERFAALRRPDKEADRRGAEAAGDP